MLATDAGFDNPSKGVIVKKPDVPFINHHKTLGHNLDRQRQDPAHLQWPGPKPTFDGSVPSGAGSRAFEHDPGEAAATEPSRSENTL